MVTNPTKAAKGTKIQYSSDSGNNYTSLAKMGDITGPRREKAVLDAIYHDSDDGYKEKTGSTKNVGDITVPVGWRPDMPIHSSLDGFFDNDTLLDWKIVYPDEANTTYTFKGFISGIEPSAPVEGWLTASITITVSGKLTKVAT